MTRPDRTTKKRRQLWSVYLDTRDFQYRINIGREIAAIAAAGFEIIYGCTQSFSHEDFQKMYKAEVQAFPSYRMDGVDTFPNIDVKAGTVKMYLNTQVTKD